MEHDDRVHRVLASESRAALLQLLQTEGRSVSASEAAQAIGLHPSTARLHLDLLVSAGLVDRATERRATVGRPMIRYTVHEAAPAAGDYRELAGVLADGLARSADPQGAAREAGRRWSEALAGEPEAAVAPDEAIGRIVALMDGLGFSPRRSGEDRVELHRCPFEAVAREQRAVVCGVHLGMLEQTLARLGGAVTVADLEPFASDHPLRCVIDLQRRSPGAPADDHIGSAADGRQRTTDG